MDPTRRSAADGRSVAPEPDEPAPSRGVLAGLAVAVATAVLGLVPTLPGARWLFALGSTLLVPLLLLLGERRRGYRRSSAIVAGLGALLLAAAALVLAGSSRRWFGWPVSAWAALVGFWVLPWLLSAGAGTANEAEGGERARDRSPGRADDAAR